MLHLCSLGIAKHQNHLNEQRAHAIGVSISTSTLVVYLKFGDFSEQE